MRRLLLLAVVAVLALTGASPALGAFSWTGTWSTNFGEMTLTETVDPATGTRVVTGRYAYPPAPGAINGTASGDVLTGTWREDVPFTGTGSGPIAFTMSADGTSFSGLWAVSGQPPAQPWNGTRVGTPTPLPGSAPPSARHLGPPPPEPATGGNVVEGFWRLRASTTSAIFHAVRRQAGRPPAPIRGITPVLTANLIRPGGCYRQVGRLEWVIGAAGRGEWRRFEPGSNCTRFAQTEARWFLNGPNGLRQRYTVDPDGPRGPRPGRTAQLFWQRIRPLLEFQQPTVDTARRRLVITFLTKAHYDHRLELVRNDRVIATATTPVRDGRWAVSFDGSSADPGEYLVRLTAGRVPGRTTRPEARLRIRLDDQLRATVLERVSSRNFVSVPS